MENLIKWALGLALTIGIGSALIKQTLEMAKAAVYAHQHKQMSYSKFTKALTKPGPKRQ